MENKKFSVACKCGPPDHLVNDLVCEITLFSIFLIVLTHSFKSIITPHLCLLKFGLNLSDDPLKGLRVQPVLLRHLLGAEDGTQQDVEEQSGVLLGHFREMVIALDDNKPAAQFSHVLYHFHRVKVRLRAKVHVEDLLSIPDEPAQVHWQDNLS